MSIESKIQQILAESQKKGLSEAEQVAQPDVNPAAAEVELDTQMGDPLAQIEIEPNNARNNVDRQDLETGEKDENEHTENAAPAEPSNLEPLAFKEDIDALVSGEELTEEFKQKAATIFEAAVLTRVKQEVARLDEAYQVQLDERVEEIKEGLVEKVDGYLDYVVEQWMKDNEIALESGMKSEILEGFVSGLKGLFEQHYIEVPEEKFDVLGSMQEQIAGLTTKLFYLNQDLTLRLYVSG